MSATDRRKMSATKPNAAQDLAGFADTRQAVARHNAEALGAWRDAADLLDELLAAVAQGQAARRAAFETRRRWSIDRQREGATPAELVAAHRHLEPVDLPRRLKQLAGQARSVETLRRELEQLRSEAA